MLFTLYLRYILYMQFGKYSIETGRAVLCRSPSGVAFCGAVQYHAVQCSMEFYDETDRRTDRQTDKEYIEYIEDSNHSKGRQ